MQARTQFLIKRTRRNIERNGTALQVRWSVQSGGVKDLATEAMVGATTALLSGQIKAFVYETQPKAVERRFAEIKAGDLLCDLHPDGLIDPYPGQGLDGPVTLDDIRDRDPEFLHQGNFYKQAKVGNVLAEMYATVFQGEVLETTILLTRK